MSTILWLAVLVLLPLPLIVIGWRRINHLRWDARFSRGDRALKKGDYDEAIRQWSAAFRISYELKGMARSSYNPFLDRTLGALIHAQAARGDDIEVKFLGAQQLKLAGLMLEPVAEGVQPIDSIQQLPEYLDVLLTLAMLYEGRDDFESAEEAILKAAQVVKVSPGAISRELSRALDRYATMLRKTRRNLPNAEIESRIATLKQAIRP